MCLDLLKTLLTDIMLHLAGILKCNIGRNATPLMHLGIDCMTLFDLFGVFCAVLLMCTVP